MAIERLSKKTPLFPEPEENTKMSRYLDTTKFISLLKYKQLFFCRLDKLEDQFEGTLPNETKEKLLQYTKYIEHEIQKTTNSNRNQESSNDPLERYETLRSLHCVNCWNKFENESYALWKIYSNINNGIMIKSDYKSIIDAFEATTQKVYCSEVKYINYKKDFFEPGSSFSPCFHKHNAYSYEHEVRLITDVKIDLTNWKHNWEKEKYEHGIMIDIDLKRLIKEIVISPFSPKWYREIIEDILKYYSLDVPIVDSELR